MPIHRLPVADQVLVFFAAAVTLYLLAVALGRMLKRRAELRLGVAYRLLSLAVALYLPLQWLGWKLLGFNLRQPPAFDVRRDLRASMIVLGILFTLAVIRRCLWEYYFGKRRGIPIPKFLQQIFAVIVFCIGLLAVAAWSYNVHLTGVQITSTVVVGVIGWAMQDLLGNVISGVALQMGKPFAAGDWLIVDQQHAEVIEVNWRSTRLRTNDDHYLDVPNSNIVRSTIVNLSYPSHLHAMRMRVGISYEAPPNQVRETLLRAVAATDGILTEPLPKIFLVSFADSALLYEVKYWIRNHAAYNEISHGLHSNIWYALKRAGIEIPFPVRTVRVERQKKTEQGLPEATHDIIRQKPFFKCLTDEEAARIISSGRFKLFAQGEKIVEQGAGGNSMFVLVNGRAEVYVRQAGNGAEPAMVGSLQTGDYFGEMSLLTGETRAATVVAASDCEVLEIEKQHMAGILQENSGLLQSLSEMLARRRIATETALASAAGKQASAEMENEYARNFLARVASFFQL